MDVRIGRKAARELVLTGKWIDAREAQRIGLINRHVPADALDEEVDHLVAELGKKSPLAMRLGLESISHIQGLDFASALAYRQTQLALLSSSDDTKERVAAFFEKREPRFTGR